MRTGERASTNLILVTALLLLSAMIARSSQQFNLSILLMQNQIFSRRAARLARNQAIENFPQPSGIYGVQCTPGTVRVGSITRSINRCDFFPAPTTAAIFYDQLFDSGEACPKRARKRTIPPDWSWRSLNECIQLNKPVPQALILNGDMFLTEELELPAADEGLIAARGSFRAPVLNLKSNLTLISLGDISIPTVNVTSGRPLHLLLIAPLGTVTIEHIKGPAGISVLARKEQIARQITRLPARPSRFFSLRSSLPLGLFNQASGLAP